MKVNDVYSYLFGYFKHKNDVKIYLITKKNHKNVCININIFLLKLVNQIPVITNYFYFCKS